MEVIMWIIGAQTAFLSAILGIIWSNINRMEERQSQFEYDMYGESHTTRHLHNITIIIRRSMMC